MPMRSPTTSFNQTDIVDSGAPGSEAGAGLDEIRTAIQDQLGGRGLLGVGEDSDFNMTLKDFEGLATAMTSEMSRATAP